MQRKSKTKTAWHMATKNNAKPIPLKKRLKSLSKRNKLSSLSLELQGKDSSDETNDELASSEAQKTSLDPVWQNPLFKTKLDVTGSPSEESERTDVLSVENASSVADGTQSEEAPGDELDSNAPPPAAGKDCIIERLLNKKRQFRPPPIDSALVIVHNQLVALEIRFQKDLHELERKYAADHYGPLIRLRNKLLEAAKALDTEITDGDDCSIYAPIPTTLRGSDEKHMPMTSFQPQASTGSPKAGTHLPSCALFDCCAKVVLANELGKQKWSLLKKMLARISNAVYRNSSCNERHVQPHKFWYYVFQRSDPILSGMLHSGDGEILSYLRDVRVNLFSTPGLEASEFRSCSVANRQHPPCMRAACRAPCVSARHSTSTPNQKSKGMGDEDAENPGPSGARLPFCYSETSNALSFLTNENRDYIHNSVIGFELEFEFYRNKYIRNSVLRKCYLIDVRQQDEDYIPVKKYNTFRSGGDCNIKADLFTSDGGDEQSSDSDTWDEPEAKRMCDRRRKCKQAPKVRRGYYKLLDYHGPRLVAIEGSTIKWKSRRADPRRKSHRKMPTRTCCLAPSDESSILTPSSAETVSPQTSFFDFFGWNWDVYRNQIMRNDSPNLLELSPTQTRGYVTRDYEVGSYIRDVVIPRAFAIYRTCKRADFKKRCHMPESILDSVSHCSSFDALEHSGQPKTNYEVRPVYALPSSPLPSPPAVEPCITKCHVGPLAQNFARNYDDVDDIVVTPVTTQRAEENARREVRVVTIDEPLASSRKKISELVKNVNTIIYQANARNAFHRPVSPAEPGPGVPLTCPIDYQMIPEVPEAPTYFSSKRCSPPCSKGRSRFSNSEYDRSSRPVSQKGIDADDEFRSAKSDVDPPSVNRAYEKIRGQFRRRSWNRGVKHEKKTRTKANSADGNDDIVSTTTEKSERIHFRQNSPFPSDDHLKVDENDVLSSSGVSDAPGAYDTPSTSEADAEDPNLCPCDLHLLEEGNTTARRRRKRKNDHILCKQNKNKSYPMCSLGRDLLADEKLREEYASQAKAQKKDDSFKEVSSTDSEAPPAPDRKSCKQQ